MHYVNTSALVKLVSLEAETGAMVAWAQSGVEVATSDISRTELMRAVRRADPALAERARDLLQRLTLITVTADVCDAAGRLDPPGVRSLDAIHLSAALQLGDELESVVTYDERLGVAARLLGIPVSAPG